MKNQLLLYTVSLCAGMLCQARTQAQALLERQVVASAGINGKMGNMIVESTVGEPVIATFTDGGIILTQGFHQPQIFLVPLAPVNGNLISGIILYPNPASVETNLEFDLLKDNDVEVLLINNAGQIMGNQHLESIKGRVKHIIPLGGRYASGMYYVVLRIEYEMHTQKLIIQ